MSGAPHRGADDDYEEVSIKEGWKSITRADEGVDGCIRIGDIESPATPGIVARIQNVTTVHRLVHHRTSWAQPRARELVFDLHALAEYGRCSLALAGPTYDGMPSVSTTIEQHPIMPRTTVSLHSGGKVVQTGCPSIEQALLAASAFRGALFTVLGLRLQVLEFRAVNIVATVDTRVQIDLRVLKRLLGVRCEYEDPAEARSARKDKKKAYSGARVASALPREKKPAKMIIFSTGNAVFMGARSCEDIVFMIAELEEFIARVRENSLALVRVVPESRHAVALQRAQRVIGFARRLSDRTDGLIPLGNWGKSE